MNYMNSLLLLSTGGWIAIIAACVVVFGVGGFSSEEAFPKE